MKYVILVFCLLCTSCISLITQLVQKKVRDARSLDASSFEYYGKFVKISNNNRIKFKGYYLTVDSTYSDPNTKLYSIIKLYTNGEVYYSAFYPERPSRFFINKKYGAKGYFYIDSNIIKMELIDLTQKVKTYRNYAISNDSLLLYKLYNRKHKDFKKIIQYSNYFIDHHTFVDDTAMFKEENLILNDYPF